MKLILLIAAWLQINGLQSEPQSESKFVQMNDVAKREQWTANDGYCGEMSLITAGLYYGQYLSQFDVRAVGNPGRSQFIEVLLGTPPELNVDVAAKAISLNYTLADISDPHDFLVWVKGQVNQGYPVAIGVYMNQSWFGLESSEGYDHIVDIIGVGSNYPLTDGTYHDDDVIYLWDHGLWTGETDLNGYTSSTFKNFQKTRKQANVDSAKGNVYSLPTDYDNFGVAITGVTDPLEETVRLRVDLLPLGGPPKEETPVMVEGSSKRPTRPNEIKLQITASDLDPAVKYNVYKYEDLKQVPHKDFNANSKGRKSWQISSAEPSIVDTIPADSRSPPTTSSIAIYRAVKANAK